MSTDILGDIVEDVAYFGDNFDEFTSASTQTRFDAMTPGKFFWEITGEGGKKNQVPCTWELRSARLTQLEILEHNRADNVKVPLLQGRLSAVDARLLIQLDDEWLSPYQLLYKRMGTSNLSLDDFEAQLHAKGLKWNSAEMSLNFQHFTPDMTVVRSLIDAMLAAGAKNVTTSLAPEARGRIKERFDFTPGKGLEVTSFVAQRTDREASRTNQGFLDFTDACIMNFSKMVRLTKLATSVQAQLDEAIAKGNLSDESRLELEKVIARNKTNAVAWNNNWGGSQEEITRQPDGSYVPGDRWFRVRVPIPRMTAIIDKEPQEFIFVTERKEAEAVTEENVEAVIAAETEDGEGVIDTTAD